MSVRGIWSKTGVIVFLLVALSACAPVEGEDAVEVPSPLQQQPADAPAVMSRLEIVDVETGERAVVYQDTGRFEAPNWSPDGQYLVFNREGRLYRIPVTGGAPERIDTGFADNVNNDHGFSPDGEWLAISHAPEGEGSQIYLVPGTGGTPRPVVEMAPSYWHGWSPDGSTLAYVARRDSAFDIYTIPVDGGEERRLTEASGLDDGPDYTADGAWIYFNPERTGVMQLYRMRPDGSDVQRMTHDESFADWFPHPSPDGEWVIFLSYDGSVEGHPPYKDVTLRLMPLEGGPPRVLVELFGGQGTINVPSWSPDGTRVAFVSYEVLER